MAAAVLTIASAAPTVAQQRAVVVDGDTISVNGERVRLMGLDAPELRGRCQHEVQLARAATTRLEQLVVGGVFLERHGRDRYRRTLAVVLDRSGRDVALVLIREQLARPYSGSGLRLGWC